MAEDAPGSRSTSPVLERRSDALKGFTVGAKVRHKVYKVDALGIQLAAAGDFLNKEKVRIEWEKLEKAPRSTTRSARGQPDNHAFTEGVLHWWKVHGSKFPAWAEAARIVFAFTPNSAAAERVFSMLKAMFGDQATNAFADYIQTAIRMLRSNKRKVGRAARPGHWSVVLACGDCGLTVAPRLSCGAAAAAGIHTRPHSFCTQSAACRCGGWHRHAERRARGPRRMRRHRGGGVLLWCAFCCFTHLELE